MTLVNIIFSATFVPVLFLMYFLLKNEGSTKKKYCFGTNLEKEYRETKEVAEITAEYKKNFRIWTIAMTVAAVPFYIIPYFSISYTLWMIWLLIVCFYPSYLVWKANSKIRKLRVEKGWYEEEKPIYVDLKSIDMPSLITFKDFVVPMLLSLMATVVAYIKFGNSGYKVYFVTLFIVAICTLIFYPCAVWTDKQRISIISENSKVNTNFARAKKISWKKYWIKCAWVNTVFEIVLLAFFIEGNYAFVAILVGCCAYGGWLIIETIRLVKRLFRIDDGYDKYRTLDDKSDDDKYWIGGQIYYNKRDKRTMIENRLGTGTTLNLATPIGMGTNVFAAFVLLFLPISCVWMIMLDFTPIRSEVIGDEIICRHLRTNYEIEIDKITDLEVVTKLPDMIKLNGNGMDRVYSGDFGVDGEQVEVFVNPQNDLFLVFDYEGTTYYISSHTDEETQTLYDELRNQ